jgi:chromate reductase
MSKAKILALSGSTRRESFNSRLLAVAAKFAEEAGAEVKLIDLADFPLPIMNQDLESEEGQPENAARLKQLFVESDGLLIASPEYNSSISPLLKNTLDWLSRRAGDEPPAIAYKGKTVALLSASPGRLGGIRGLVHVRSVLNTLGSLVLADQGSVSSAFSAFDDDGNLVNDHDVKRIESVTSQLVDILTRLQTD